MALSARRCCAIIVLGGALACVPGVSGVPLPARNAEFGAGGEIVSRDFESRSAFSSRLEATLVDADPFNEPILLRDPPFTRAQSSFLLSSLHRRHFRPKICNWRGRARGRECSIDDASPAISP